MSDLEKYIERYSSAAVSEAALLAELERATNLRAMQPKMLSGAVQGAFLRMMVAIVKPRRVLEIGTFTGYSALAMAAGLDGDARLHTVEVDDELEDLARSFFARSAHGERIEMHVGSALDVVPKLGGVFDFVFIDGDKRQYPDYLRMLLGDGSTGCGVVRAGSVILADNVLWYGKVADGSANRPADRHTEAIREFNAMVAADPRLENVIVPLRDGLNLIRVKK